jgi:hypothetical protein
MLHQPPSTISLSMYCHFIQSGVVCQSVHAIFVRALRAREREKAPHGRPLEALELRNDVLDNHRCGENNEQKAEKDAETHEDVAKIVSRFFIHVLAGISDIFHLSNFPPKTFSKKT